MFSNINEFATLSGLEKDPVIILEPEGIEVQAREAWDWIRNSEEWEEVCSSLSEIGLGNDFRSFLKYWEVPASEGTTRILGEAVRSAALAISGPDLFGPYLHFFKSKLVAARLNGDFAWLEGHLRIVEELLNSRLERTCLDEYYMQKLPPDFILGVLVGQLQLVIDEKGKESSSYRPLAILTEFAKHGIKQSVSRERGRQRHKWAEGLRSWLEGKVWTECIGADGKLKRSIRETASRIKIEAMEYRKANYESVWPTEQAAFEWLQKAISKIIKSERQDTL
ncbi:hypothetical protein [Marinimicrobium sp. ABcell2]|uniref:hypothetical protein n=1 Tax=Marinimicrobium sp. ABcell2 TaxID=3069751 RepID=UPI0027B2391F|nr:hypothetical protein [Marinimicrobium sp. ABcell2]MDQ2076081.1 hypothetical protein [Marinimicrobium sp. ABcell2]